MPVTYQRIPDSVEYFILLSSYRFVILIMMWIEILIDEEQMKQDRRPCADVDLHPSW